MTVDGQPLPQGTVLFQSTSQGDGPTYTARATIGPDGAYRLSTFTQNDGAVAGVHRVAVLASTYDTPEFSGRSDPLLVPAQYGLPSTSGLEFEVKETSNRIDIELHSRHPQ